jgi:hypothetical protein
MFDDDGPTVCTPNCGCCSETYNASFDESFPWDDDELIAFVEQEEQRVAALREDLNDYLSRKDN